MKELTIEIKCNGLVAYSRIPENTMLTPENEEAFCITLFRNGLHALKRQLAEQEIDQLNDS